MLSNTTQDTVATGGSKQSEMQGTKTARQEEIEWRRNTWVNSKMHQGCCNAYLDDHPSGDEPHAGNAHLKRSARLCVTVANFAPSGAKSVRNSHVQRLGVRHDKVIYNTMKGGR
ncbi:unnamed protein product [Prorocentrum cordatum]|uniref:Uncharacterized protein n=1 Tax=Prorocentrum cordatum TaxID=2364126 RepID=A0ABN9XL76_9DINO|nr:unnamed protein product [Polarella glacialis]